MKITELVIARYNENLNWIDKVPKDIKITIYNKGKNDIPYNYIKLPNEGRESNTYLHHITYNYYNLSDRIIFVQGYPFDHSPNFIELLKKKNIFKEIQGLTNLMNFPDNLKKASKNALNTKLNDLLLYTEYVNNNFDPCYPTYWYNGSFEKVINKIKETHKVENVLKYFKKKLKLKNIDLNYLIPVNYSANFSVDKKLIKKNSLEFYENMNKILLKTKEYDLGFIIERLWLSIFNYQKYNKNYKKLTLKEFDLKDYIYKPSISNLQETLTYKKRLIYRSHITIYLDNDKEYVIYVNKDKLLIKDKNNKKEYIEKFKNNINDYYYITIKNNPKKSLIQIHEYLLEIDKEVLIKKIIFHNLSKDYYLVNI